MLGQLTSSQEAELTPRVSRRHVSVVDGASLAVVRVVYGGIGVLSMVRLVAYRRIGPLYTDPPHHLSYPGLRFVTDLGPVGTHLLVVALGALALLVALGVATRPALVAFVAGFSWLEFVDASTYLNHYWFVTVLGVLLVLAPVDTCFALRPRPRPVARGWVWLVRALAGSVYCYAGLAKLTGDWLVHGLPLRFWLPARSTLPVVGPLLERRETALLLSWAGAAFDCSIVALLSIRRTRPFAWLALVGFHVATWILFPIGVFPWLMIGMSTVFFTPSWPRELPRRVRDALSRRRVGVGNRVGAVAGAAPASAGAVAGPSRSAPIEATTAPPAGAAAEAAAAGAPFGSDRWAWRVALAWTCVVLVLPMRAAVIPGDARWTGEGYRFAWNVLRVERAGDVVFRITDRDTGLTWVDTAESLYTPLQWKTMVTEPELIRQAAHLLRRNAAAEGHDVEVRVDAFVSLNGRAATRIVDPTVDLSREPYRPLGQPWILPAPTTPPP